MPSAIGNLAISVTAQTAPLRNGLRRARQSIGKFRKSVNLAKVATKQFNAVLGRIGLLAGGAALIGGIIRLFRSVEDFNRAMNQSIAIMSDVDSVMREKMQRTAIEVAATVKFSSAEVAKAYFFLASAGLSASQSIAALPQVAQFAQAGIFNLARATDLLTDAQSALGLTVKDTQRNLANMTRVADVLVKANTLANASVEQFSEALTTKAAAALRFVGKEIEEGAAILAVFADQGKKGADAGTALDIVLRELSRKAIINKAAFELHGLAVFDATGQMRKTADIVQDLTQLLSAMGTELKDATLIQLGFTAKSISNIKALIGMSDKLREYEAAMASAGGITAKVSDKQLTPMQNAMAKLTETWGFFAASITTVTNALAAFIELSADTRKFATNLTTLITENLSFSRMFKKDAFTGFSGAPRFADKGDKIVFITSEEEQTIERIAERFKEITEERAVLAAAAEKAAAADKEAATARERIAVALAAEEQARARIAEKKEESRLAMLAREIVERTRTPLETLNRTLSTIKSVADRISQETFDRAVQAAETAFDRTAGAIDRTFDTLAAKARDVFEATRTPLERFKKDLAELELLGLTPDTFARAVVKLRETLAGTLKKVAEPITGTFATATAASLGLAAVGAPAAGGPLLARTNRVQDQQLDELQEMNRKLDDLIRGGGLTP